MPPFAADMRKAVPFPWPGLLHGAQSIEIKYIQD
jgi:hypothetical protein